MVGASLGYETNAVCLVSSMLQGQAVTERTRIVEICMDGARILTERPIPVGSLLRMKIEGYRMGEVKGKITANLGDHGSGYLLEVRLGESCWPYDVFSKLTTLGASNPGPKAAPTPPCLKELGLTMPCTVEAVEIAFARRVRQAHPDRGGDVESFSRLRTAYLEALRLLGGKR